MKWDLPPIPSHEEIDNRPVKCMVCLLNLVLSCIAAIQAPVILMSQNRQEEKDRVRAEHDYRVNLKAEFEIRSLHEKIDHMLVHCAHQKAGRERGNLRLQIPCKQPPYSA